MVDAKMAVKWNARKWWELWAEGREEEGTMRGRKYGFNEYIQNKEKNRYMKVRKFLYTA